MSSVMGRHNPRLVDIRKAIRRGDLTSDGLLPVEGPHLIEEARRSGLEIAELYVREGENCSIPAGQIHRLSPPTFHSIRATREPQGLLALVRPRTVGLETILSGKPEIWIVLCGLQDPGNAGTVLRLGDAFGVAGCIRALETVGFYNNKLVRASAGSVFRVPWTSVEDLDGTCRAMRSRGISILGTAAAAAHGPDDWDWDAPTAVLLGREGAGLTREERHLCDMIVKIPHSARVESLNVASVAAILLYEAARHRSRGIRGE